MAIRIGFIRLGAALLGLVCVQAYALDFNDLGEGFSCSHQVSRYDQPDGFGGFRFAVENLKPRQALDYLRTFSGHYREQGSPRYVSYLLWALSVTTVTQGEGAGLFENAIYEEIKRQQRLLISYAQTERLTPREKLQIQNCLMEIAVRLGFRLTPDRALTFWKLFVAYLSNNFTPLPRRWLSENLVRSAFTHYADLHVVPEDLTTFQYRANYGPELDLPRLETDLYDRGEFLRGNESEPSKRARRFVSHLFLMFYDVLQHDRFGGELGRRLRDDLPDIGFEERRNWLAMSALMGGNMDTVEAKYMSTVQEAMTAESPLTRHTMLFQLHYPFTMWGAEPRAPLSLSQMANFTNFNDRVRQLIDELPNPGLETSLAILFRENTPANLMRIKYFFSDEIYLRSAMRERLLRDATQNGVEFYEAAAFVRDFSESVERRARRARRDSKLHHEEDLPAPIRLYEQSPSNRAIPR